MPRSLLGVLATLALVYLGLCALLFVFQRSLIYFPQPRSLGPGATMIALPIDGGQVLVTTRPHAGPDALLYFGGNAEDVSLSLPELAAGFPDHALYLMHYRGYGGSSGSPSESALVADALALSDKVRAEHPNLVVVGRSLGSGVAVQLASQRPVARLILVTPYDSILGLAMGQFPIFPVRWLLRDRFESSPHAPSITAPTLVVVAEHDEVIPRASSEALFRRFPPGVASFEVVPRTGHNTISDSPRYLQLLRGQP